ncbi:MAG: hypothetical protein ABSD58_07260 [Verrucomicrobiia bacterium]
MNVWQTIITALGGTALLLGAVAWLVKKIVVHFLDKDVEAYKVKMLADAGRQLEAFKAELRLRWLPAVKGGGDCTMSRPVQLEFDSKSAGSVSPGIAEKLRAKTLILLDANSSFVYLAATNDAGGPSEWRSSTSRPTVYEVRRDAIIGITYCSPSGATNANGETAPSASDCDGEDL